MTLSVAFDEFQQEVEDIVTGQTVSLYSKLVAASPVDSGNFKSSWQVPKQESTYSWTIKNDAVYASVLWDGRRFSAGQMRGSEQWPEGGEPMLVNTNRQIQQAFNRLKK